jgi:hypothetical protein
MGQDLREALGLTDLSDCTDGQLAADSSKPGSPQAYWVGLEFRRRELEIARQTSAAQIKAAQWTMYSALAVAVSVVVTAFGIWADVIQVVVNK